MLVAADGAFRVAVQDQAREGKGEGGQTGHHGGEGSLVEGFFVAIRPASSLLEHIGGANGFSSRMHIYELYIMGKVKKYF
jgi:hypothetical protein